QPDPFLAGPKYPNPLSTRPKIGADPIFLGSSHYQNPTSELREQLCRAQTRREGGEKSTGEKKCTRTSCKSWPKEAASTCLPTRAFGKVRTSPDLTKVTIIKFLCNPSTSPTAPPTPSSTNPFDLTIWGDSPDPPESTKSLVVCNPLTRQFRVLPQLGSAWSRHGSVFVDSQTRVMVLTELAALYFSGSNQWLKFSSNLPSKPRSPILVFDSVYALCDVGSPWRSEWKLFHCTISKLKTSQTWTRLEKHEWGDVFDILKRPRLVCGNGNKVLMVGGLKSSFSLNASCSTILILKLDLDSLEWDEAGRMPVEMFKCFQESSKFKVFGGGDRVCFSAKRIGRLALWDRCSEKAEWRWIDGMAATAMGVYCASRYAADIGMRRDVVKVSVEDMARRVAAGLLQVADAQITAAPIAALAGGSSNLVA
ncbi:SKP1-interacting partner 15-like, partial [Pyrus x bretschneideri]|uniref:SKP1-interacting partner 15-like n=1 Tax=Pyrus x bretschneideri TaxID=225117 RepID=UPI00202F1B5D